MRHTHGCSEREKRNSNHPQWRAYGVWSRMKYRCQNEDSPDYPNYGGRGITVCERWQEFENFYHDMGAPPLGMSIDRTDNNGNYERKNCTWANRRQQNTNRRNRREFTHNGVTLSLTEWARHLGVPRRLLQVRMDRGWSVERMLNPTIHDTRFKRKDA